MAMRMSRLFGRTLREAPAEAEAAHHRLALRAGLITQHAAGIYSYMPLAWRVIRKVEQIIREEMDAEGTQELLMPAIQPRELWEETGRADDYGPVLFQLQDRRERRMVLAPTHEETSTDLFRQTVQSYRDLPQRIYQFQTKFRDEARPRSGVIRTREFIMKDAYSFDADEAAARDSYAAMRRAYVKIFERIGITAIPVAADSGAIGGGHSEEFVYLTEVGEDSVAVCPACGYAANQERAEFARGPSESEPPLPIEEVATPGVSTIAGLAEFLGIPERKTAKATFFMADGQPIFAVIRGDLEINELKLQNTLGARDLRPMTDEEVAATGWVAGYASPVDLGAANDDIVADISIPEAPNLVAGANKVDAHLRHVNYGRDWTAGHVADIGLARSGDPCPRACQGRLALQRGIEVGHIFQLGTKYSAAMQATFTDADGERRVPIMGSYGIGVTRLLAAIMQAHHDDQGIIWPRSVAPYDVHVVAIGLDRDDAVGQALARLESDLEAAGFSVLSDDRDERPGVKFNDADLLGMPVRLTVSPRNLKAGVVEVKRRGAEEAPQVAAGAVVGAVQAALAAAQESNG